MTSSPRSNGSALRGSSTSTSVGSCTHERNASATRSAVSGSRDTQKSRDPSLSAAPSAAFAGCGRWISAAARSRSRLLRRSRNAGVAVSAVRSGASDGVRRWPPRPSWCAASCRATARRLIARRRPASPYVALAASAIHASSCGSHHFRLGRRPLLQPVLVWPLRHHPASQRLAPSR